MSTELDPYGAEPRALLGATDFAAMRVLEIGAGDGRLTFRYVGETRFTVGIDLDPGAVFTARGTRPAGLGATVELLPASALTLPFRDGTFDIAILAWSL